MPQNQCSPIIKTFLIVMFSCCMIAHHWTWDEVCDEIDGHTGGIEMNIDTITEFDFDKGHSYTFNSPQNNSGCGTDNNTDNRAYLAFYILTLIVALIGFCCLLGQAGEGVYGGFLIVLWVWWIFMEGLRVHEMHSYLNNWTDMVSLISEKWEDAARDVYRSWMSYYVGQFLLYTILFIGTATDCFDCCSCQCVKTVVVSRKAVIEV